MPTEVKTEPMIDVGVMTETLMKVVIVPLMIVVT